MKGKSNLQKYSANEIYIYNFTFKLIHRYKFERKGLIGFFVLGCFSQKKRVWQNLWNEVTGLIKTEAEIKIVKNFLRKCRGRMFISEQYFSQDNNWLISKTLLCLWTFNSSLTAKSNGNFNSLINVNFRLRLNQSQHKAYLKNVGDVNSAILSNRNRTSFSKKLWRSALLIAESGFVR